MIFSSLQTRPDPLLVALDLPQQGVLSLVGAGGKTTLMWRLASVLTAQGLRLACTATTKLFPPTFSQAELLLAQNNPFFFDHCRQKASNKKPLCLAWSQQNNKILGLIPDLVDQLKDAQIFDWILVEADGARCLPLKAPAPYEPVIPTCSTHVLAVVGLNALGQPIDEEHVCRSQYFAQLTGQTLGTKVTTESIALLCAHPHGVFKSAPIGATRLLWLNQADTAARLRSGQDILKKLRVLGPFPSRAYLGTAQYNPYVLELWS